MTSSKFVDCSTAKSAGLPFKILSTYIGMRRHKRADYIDILQSEITRLSLSWSHNGAAHSDPLDRRCNEPSGLRLLNELARIRQPEFPPLR